LRALLSRGDCVSGSVDERLPYLRRRETFGFQIGLGIDAREIVECRAIKLDSELLAEARSAIVDKFQETNPF